MRKPIVLLAVFALLPFGLVACGGGDDESSSSSTAATGTDTSGGAGGGGSAGGGGGGVALSADPSSIAYDSSSLSASAGDVTIDFDNPSGIPHDVCLESSSGDDLGCSDVVTSSSSTLDAGNLDAGDYTFYCSVDSHRDQGMEGTLTVD
jgi:plastocyanin